MIQFKDQEAVSYSLMVIILNRGKGSQALELACKMGACDASCFLGRGTVKNKLLQLLAVDEVEKEIVLTAVPSNRELAILNSLDDKFHFERPDHGIAFTMPLTGLFKIKRDEELSWGTSDLSTYPSSEYTALLFITEKGAAEKAVQINQDAGYYGGTIIKAHGAPEKTDRFFDMEVDPEKEVALLLMPSSEADKVANLLHRELYPDKEVQGILVKIAVSRAVGLFKDPAKDMRW